MPNSPYTKRETDLMLEGIKTHMEDVIKPICDKTDKILAQTTKTNGRVSSLEKWRSYTVGAVSIITLIVIPFVFMLLKNSL